MTDKHTPTPWFVNSGMRPPRIYAVADHTITICDMAGWHVEHWAERDANTALIVRAVNRDHLFGELVTALEALLDETVDALVSTFGDGPPGDKLADEPVIRRARAVLAKVEASDG